jgi:hypothetical protein
VLGLVGVSVAIRGAIGQSHPSILLGWFAAEVVAPFLFTLAALLERLFAGARELRQDNELTVDLGQVTNAGPATWKLRGHLGCLSTDRGREAGRSPRRGG